MNDHTVVRMPPSLRLVITGMARSGTGYMAELLTKAGLPCTHEKTFHTLERIDLGASSRDSSCFAAPYLGALHPTTAVVHIVRSPLSWLKSWMRKHLTSEYLSRHLRIHYAWRNQMDPVSAAMQAWVSWNLMCEAHAWCRYRVEDLTEEDLCAIARAAGDTLSLQTASDALATTPRNVNSVFREAAASPALVEPLWQDSPHPIQSPLPEGRERERFLALGARYGYRLD